MTFEYDALGRRTHATNRAGGVTVTGYDKADRVVSVTDPLGKATAVGYDRLGRATSVTNPLGNATLVGYDANGNRTWVEDALGNKTSFMYNAADRLTAKTDPLGQSTANAYDDANRVTGVTDRLGRARAFAFDDAGRRTGETWYAAGGAMVQAQAFTYDAGGNLLTATDPDGSYAFTYDPLGRVATTSQPFGFAQAFAYDPAGNRTLVTDNKGGTTASAFDLADRLVTRTFTDGTAAARLDYAYTDRDELKAVTRSADLAGTTPVGTSEYGYDAGGRVTAITHKDKTGATLAGYAYQYDLADRLTLATEGGTSTAYAYDAAGQLVQAGAAVYAYDEAGNRTSATVAAGNRVAADGGWAYGYDAAGHQTSKAKAGEQWTYSYDHRGQLTKAERAGGGRVEYAYDALGNRVRRAAYDAGGAVVTDERYALDGWDPADRPRAGGENFDAVADLDAAGGVAARRVYGDGFDALGVRVDGAGAAWYLGDRLGSVRAVTDAGGAVAGTRAYDAFGGVTSASGGGLDRYGWTGREVDDTTGLQFNRARWYDPAAVTAWSAGAVAYLVAVAVVALPAYNRLLAVTSPAAVGTYAFVNPVVAVLLGWAVAGEPVAGRTAPAAGLVVLGVVLLVWPRKKVACEARG